MALSEHEVDRAGHWLADLRVRANGRNSPAKELPAAVRPVQLADAYRIQAAARAYLRSGPLGPQVGWKVGCTTPVMQSYLAIPHPCAGTLYRTTLYAQAAELRAADYFQLGLECELAVRLGSDLAAAATPYDMDSVAPAVAGVMASIEIVEHRFDDFALAGVASLVADDFFSVGCVLGAEVALDAVPDLAALRGGFWIDDAPPTATGTGEAILGHPLRALAWLANHALAQGEHLRAGQVATLGSVVKTIYPEPGQTLQARFEDLGPATVRVV